MLPSLLSALSKRFEILNSYGFLPQKHAYISYQTRQVLYSLLEGRDIDGHTPVRYDVRHPPKFILLKERTSGDNDSKNIYERLIWPGTTQRFHREHSFTQTGTLLGSWWFLRDLKIKEQ